MIRIRMMPPLLAVLLATLVYKTSAGSLYERGPYNTTHVYLNALLTVGLEENIDAWVPVDAGDYPVFYYIDSFGGITPGNAYTDTMDHIASHGIAVAIIWKLALPVNPLDKLPIFESALAWVEAHLEDHLHNNGVPETVHLDQQRLVLGGHSAGSHVLTDYLKKQCGNAKGQVLMSPVDGGIDPDTGDTIFCITPGETLNYDIPSLVMPAGLDNLAGVGGFPCAPDGISNARFYNALSPNARSWMINATEFGHADFLDPEYQEAVEAMNFCGWNHDATDEYMRAYRVFIGGQTLAFMKALFEPDCTEYLPYLQDPEQMLVDTTVTYNNPDGGCPIPGCTWRPISYQHP